MYFKYTFQVISLLSLCLFFPVALSQQRASAGNHCDPSLVPSVDDPLGYRNYGDRWKGVMSKMLQAQLYSLFP